MTTSMYYIAAYRAFMKAEAASEGAGPEPEADADLCDTEDCDNPQAVDDELCAECRQEHEPCCNDYYCPCGNQNNVPS